MFGAHIQFRVPEMGEPFTELIFAKNTTGGYFIHVEEHFINEE